MDVGITLDMGIEVGIDLGGGGGSPEPVGAGQFVTITTPINAISGCIVGNMEEET